MKRTVKSCYDCKRLYKVYTNIINGEYCKFCRIKIQRKSELKLSKYLQIKYNN